MSPRHKVPILELVNYWLVVVVLSSGCYSRDNLVAFPTSRLQLGVSWDFPFPLYVERSAGRLKMEVSSVSMSRSIRSSGIGWKSANLSCLSCMMLPSSEAHGRRFSGSLLQIFMRYVEGSRDFP